MNTTVSWLGLAVSLLLVAIAAGISWWQRLGLQRQILVAAARALIQLLLVGARIRVSDCQVVGHSAREGGGPLEYHAHPAP